MNNLAVFNQSLDWLDDRASRLSRQAFQWLRPLVDRVNFLTGVAVVPPKGVVWANLSAADIAAYFTAGLGNAGDVYDGWAICDGSNGTPNLADRFVRAKVTGSGATGGSDSSAHTHAIDHDHGAFTSASESGHTHAIDHDHASFTSGSHTLLAAEIPSHTHGVGTLANSSESSHTHGIGSYVAANESSHTHAVALVSDGAIVGGNVQLAATGNTFHFGSTGTGAGTSGAGSSHTHTLSGTSGAGSSHTHTISGSTASAGSDGGHTHAVDPPAFSGTSGASSGHTHSIDVPAITATSGAASATENRPAYYELVPLMRVWT